MGLFRRKGFAKIQMMEPLTGMVTAVQNMTTIPIGVFAPTVGLMATSMPQKCAVLAVEEAGSVTQMIIQLALPFFPRTNLKRSYLSSKVPGIGATVVRKAF